MNERNYETVVTGKQFEMCMLEDVCFSVIHKKIVLPVRKGCEYNQSQLLKGKHLALLMFEEKQVFFLSKYFIKFPRLDKQNISLPLDN